MGRCMSSSSYEHLANGIAAVVLTESEQFSDVSNQSAIFQGYLLISPCGHIRGAPPEEMVVIQMVLTKDRRQV